MTLTNLEYLPIWFLVLLIVIAIIYTSRILWDIGTFDTSPSPSIWRPPSKTYWKCHYCGMSNDVDIKKCGHCGSPRRIGGS